jgi:4-amino-4-deoxy-L-arabinose transferase-like glycosyltransferase
MSVRAMSLAMAGLLALAFLSQGLSAPFEKDEESRPASVIADILHRGDWLLPTDSYGEVTRKPPLYYWLSAAVAEVRGRPLDEAGARIVSVAAGAVLTALVMGYAWAWFGGAAGWLAWVFLLGSYGFTSHAAYARTDMLFTLFLFAAYCLLYPAVEGEESARWWLPGGVMLGLAVLTKGPLAIALCGLAIAIYLLLERRNPMRLAARPWPWLTLVVSMAIAAAWYLPAFLKTGGGVASVQLMQENIGHLLPATMGGTGEAHRPFYYIVARFLGACFPLCLYLPALFLMLRPLRKAGRPLLYQLGMFIAVLGLFSLASAKRDDYILPAFPPFAIMLAAMIVGARRMEFPAAARVRDLAGALAGALMLIGAAGGLILSGQDALVHRLSAHMQSSDADYLRLFVNRFWHDRQAIMILLMVAGSAAALIAWRRGNSRASAGAVGIASMAAVSLWIGVLRPGLAAQRTFGSFAHRMRQVTGGQTVFTPGGPDYEVSYYYGSAITPLLWAHDDGSGAPRYVLVWDNWPKLPGEKADSSQVVLTSRHTLEGHRMVLLKVDANQFESLLKHH